MLGAFVFDTPLIDLTALALVLVGTVLATIAQSGWRDIGNALRTARGLMRPGFDTTANRRALARWASAVRKRGILSVDEPFPPDRIFARGVVALVRVGSLRAMQDVHEAARGPRMDRHARATRVFEQAGELAPVFGLVGTLFAMTQITSGLAIETSTSAFAAIATAVLSSLYGVLSANLVFLPLAQAIARRSQREEEARAALAKWLADEVEDVIPKRSHSVTPLHAAV